MNTTYARAICRSKRTSTYYKTCPYCGARLDPNEKCDCEKSRGMAAAKARAGAVGAER